MQAAIGLLFLVITAGIAAVFLWVALSTRRPAAYPSPPALGQVRRVWGIALGAVLIGLFAFSLANLPYPWAKGEAPTVTVQVRAFQFGWQIAPRQLPKGATVEFRVTAQDVNHGFGVYSPGGRLLGQTQAMPGYTNRLVLTFTEPGTYTVRCLEFCGVGHHVMRATFEVTD